MSGNDAQASGATGVTDSEYLLVTGIAVAGGYRAEDGSILFAATAKLGRDKPSPFPGGDVDDWLRRLFDEQLRETLLLFADGHPGEPVMLTAREYVEWVAEQDDDEDEDEDEDGLDDYHVSEDECGPLDWGEMDGAE